MKGIWTRPAARDLEAIQDSIARDNPVAAYRLAQTVRQRANHLADHPNIGRQGRGGGTREFVISGTPYIVPYRVRGDQVEILPPFTALESGRRVSSKAGPTPASRRPRAGKNIRQLGPNCLMFLPRVSQSPTPAVASRSKT